MTKTVYDTLFVVGEVETVLYFFTGNDNEHMEVQLSRKLIKWTGLAIVPLRYCTLPDNNQHARRKSCSEGHEETRSWNWSKHGAPRRLLTIARGPLSLWASSMQLAAERKSPIGQGSRFGDPPSGLAGDGGCENWHASCGAKTSDIANEFDVVIDTDAWPSRCQCCQLRGHLSAGNREIEAVINVIRHHVAKTNRRNSEYFTSNRALHPSSDVE